MCRLVCALVRKPPKTGFLASKPVSPTNSASGLVTVIGNTSLHSDTLENISTAKHNDLISSTALTPGTYSGTVGFVSSAPLGNVTSNWQPLTTNDHQQLHGSNYVDIRYFHGMKSISYQHKIRISRDVVRDVSVRATHLGNFGWILAQQLRQVQQCERTRSLVLLVHVSIFIRKV